MKKNNYIQPAFEVTAITATYNVLSESNPWSDPQAAGDEIQQY